MEVVLWFSAMANENKYTWVRITPLEGEPYEIGEGGDRLNLIQMQSGQYIQQSFNPNIKYEPSFIKKLQPEAQKTPFKFQGQGMGADAKKAD